MELPSLHPDGHLGRAFALLGGPDLRDVDPLVRLAAEHGALIAFAIDPRGDILRVRGPVPDAIADARGDTEGQNVFELYADVPALLGAVARALRGTTVHARLQIDGATLDCHYVPVRDADGAVIGVRGVAFPLGGTEAVPTAAEPTPTMNDEGLSLQEQRVVRRLARGIVQADIARRLFLASSTISEYLRRVRRRLKLENNNQLIALAVRRGWDADTDGDRVDDDPTD